jgi:3-hydroxyacyl-CoA dehydrogenase
MIQRAAVLGAGTMGSRIAGHLANAGLPVLLLDVTPELADRALELLKTARPPALFDTDVAGLIETGSFNDHLAKITSCDWVIEAVTEDLSIKRALLEKASTLRRPDAIFTTNTSGLPVTQIAAGLPEDFRRHWFGVHFFNPPRFMRLVEFIPTPDTDERIVALLQDFVVERLGKTIVTAKDTPNFIANRVGIFALLNNARLLQQLDLTIEEVDALTGPVIGWPATATFRLMDLIGIDIVAKTYDNFASRVTDERSDIILPDFIRKMMERGWLGDKSGQGFYRKGPEPAALDWKTLEYRRPNNPKFSFLSEATKIRSLPERFQFLLVNSDPKAEFYRRMLPELWEYARNRVPEIADNPADIDTAMKAGFNWELGPFEMQHLPGAVGQALGLRGPHRPAISAALLDLGDDIACIEFRTKMNAIDEAILSFVEETLSAPHHRAYVIGSATAANFSAGANLATILQLINEKNWKALERFISAFQRMTQSVKFCSRPVVAAPFGLCLGGGAEVVLHAHARQAHAELSMGLVEISVGLIPGGGGCKEMALRALDGELTWMEAFQVLTSGQRCGSARQAQRMRLLKTIDGITMNRDLLIRDAIEVAHNEFQPKTLRQTLAGADQAPFENEIEARRTNGAFTEHDARIAKKVAGILCAGISEQHLLDLEREAFVSLCAQPKTAERIAHMLKTGKPLRN